MSGRALEVSLPLFLKIIIIILKIYFFILESETGGERERVLSRVYAGRAFSCSNKIPWCVFTSHVSCIRSSADGHLGCFCLLSVANKAATNVLVRIFVQPCFQFPQNDTRGWNRGVMWKSVLNSVRNCAYWPFLYLL